MIQTCTVIPNNDLERINAVKCSRKGRKRKATKSKPIQHDKFNTSLHDSDTSGVSITCYSVLYSSFFIYI